MRNQLSFCAIRDILISIQKSLFRRHIYLFCCQISLFGHKMFHIHFTEWPQHLMARWFRTRKKKNAALQMSNAKKSSQSVCLSTSYEAICELLHCSQQLSWYGHLLPAGAFTHSGRLSSHCGLEFSCLGVGTELARKLYHIHTKFGMMCSGQISCFLLTLHSLCRLLLSLNLVPFSMRNHLHAVPCTLF